MAPNSCLDVPRGSFRWTAGRLCHNRQSREPYRAGRPSWPPTRWEHPKCPKLITRFRKSPSVGRAVSGFPCLRGPAFELSSSAYVSVFCDSFACGRKGLAFDQSRTCDCLLGLSMHVCFLFPWNDFVCRFLICFFRDSIFRECITGNRVVFLLAGCFRLFLFSLVTDGLFVAFFCFSAFLFFCRKNLMFVDKVRYCGSFSCLPSWRLFVVASL